MSNQKIGMCCGCGEDCPKAYTVIIAGNEYCPMCAELIGLEPDEDLD